MATSNLKSNLHQHVRSISLPSAPHSLNPQVNELLSRLKASEVTTSSLSSIGSKLRILEDMYDSLDDLVLLPNTQKAFAKNEKWAEEVLDGYLRLLDLCAMAKEISTNSKQDLQSLLSVLRRRRDGNEFERYINSRKQTKKMIRRSLKDLKIIKNRHKSNESMAISSMFLEVEEASIEVLESLMLYIAGSKHKSNLNVFVKRNTFGNSLSSKDEVSEFENVDVALDLLLKKKADKLEDKMQIKNIQSQLEDMGLSIEDVEQDIECLFRRLIKSRVSLLNIHNH